MNRNLIILIASLLISSCTIIQVVKKIRETEVDIITFKSSEKIVHFIGMVHIGKPEFYSGVYRIADSLKAKGFVVFHEGTTENKIGPEKVDSTYRWLQESKFAKYYQGATDKDSIVKNIYLRKLRRMIGFVPDSLRYLHYFKEKGLFKNMVDQPRFQELKTDERDHNFDVSMIDIIHEYERKFGSIELKELDFSLVFGPRGHLKQSETLPRKKVKEAVIDFRDEHLAKEIINSPHSKIVVIYGLGHLEGTFEHLKKLDKSWVKK